MAVVQDILIYQGADFVRNITLTDQNGMPLNVAGFTANGAIKSDPYSNTANVFLFITNLTTGNLEITMQANVTANIMPGTYAYDVMMNNGTETFKVAEGLATVDFGIAGYLPLTKG